MHFALPPRKTSRPPPYLPRTSRLPGLRKTRAKLFAIAGVIFFTFIYLLTRSSSGWHAVPLPRVPKGDPPVVLVTVLDASKYNGVYLETVKQNRLQYAEKHGYQTLLPKIGDYDLGGSPFSWAKVVAMMDALTKFPDARYVWYLDASGFIMDPNIKIEDDIMESSKLDELMKRDYPVVPPDSIIKTFSHLKGQDVDLVLTQDKEGLTPSSMIVRNGEWARFFLQTWWGPLYRGYAFEKAETHALEHIVQWHPTILSRLAIIDQRLLNSYDKGEQGEQYKDGDFVISFSDCAESGPEACESQSRPYVQAWRKAFEST
ncbi:hypothetical protein VTH82DRAFT_8304 [Thermothelomyces myriococcoides]